ncbi:hypothetical protein O6H91_09G060500 [Diphasiastrum complanatum]|uniref:Uncharacterized protein n=1 Tax=Diphasiastrum complanatum TaxID=34168 RepID=A0ACC2CPR0_DIPCM|nr:hypothetical protein O6H91_09G060500 [Diphasiastrum complanatum]
MATATLDKSADQLRHEIEVLNQQRREITERLRDPRGLRKGGPIGPNARNIGTGFSRGRGMSQQGLVQRGEQFDSEEQPLTKKRLLSAVVKVHGPEEGVESNEAKGEQAHENDVEHSQDDQKDQRSKPVQNPEERRRDRKGDATINNFHIKEPVPRILPKVDDPSLVKRNRRMFGALLGTLEQFRKEDKMMSSSEAFLRRSDSLRRAEEKAQEESERLRQQEREELAEKRKRDLTLRARLAAKAEEKQLELLFIQWTEHHIKLTSFLKTKAEPCIFYMPAKPSDEDLKLLQDREKEFTDWKMLRREELSSYQSCISGEHLANVETEIKRWQAGPRLSNSNGSDLQTESEEGQLDETFKEKTKVSKLTAMEVDNTEDDAVEDDDDDDERMDDVHETGEGLEVGMPEVKRSSSSALLQGATGYGSGNEDGEQR